MKIFKVNPRNPGDGIETEKEAIIENADLKIYKFNNRPKPKSKDKILIITNFSEFGCETISLMYCIPRILKKYPGMYVVCVGWYGREYLYRHLVDEYWEVSESFQHLRVYSNAFNNSSKNIQELENKLKDYGRVIKSKKMSNYCIPNICNNCGFVYLNDSYSCNCLKCGSSNIQKSLFSNVKNNKEEMVKIPRPSEEKMASAKKYLRENSVGIFARGRITYGRNLNDDFYIKLIKHLLSNGYNPIWLGEKQSVKPCPIEGIIDFSRMPESKDLELTLAIISQLKFTIQFWTASTRLASMMDVPWILFESPDQIYGDIGQEGKRIYLSTEESKKKIVLAQYHDVVEDYDSAIMFLDQAIKEIKEENWEDIIGPCKYPDVVRAMMKRKEEWI